MHILNYMISILVTLVLKMGGDGVVYQSVPAKEKICEDAIPEHLIHTPPPKGFGVRHLQALVLFISLTIAYFIKAHLGITIVAMTKIASENYLCEYFVKINSTDLGIYGTNGTEAGAKYLHNCTERDGTYSAWNVYRTYNWNKATQEMIMSSFFVGYTTMMLPMGFFAQKYGGKLPILVALVVNGVVSILTPWVPIFAGWIGVCVCRLLQGMTQAAFYPCVHTLLGKWAPLSERGRLSTYIYTGSQFGTILIFQISGLFAGISSLGWPSIFWLCGILSLLCFGMLAKLGADSPHEHPSISSEELIFIIGEGSADAGSEKRKTPWKQILTSPAVWGLVAGHAGSGAGYLLILTQTPTYMSKVLGVDIKHNGLYSSLPYLSMYVLTLASGHISDMLVTKKVMSIANVRRLMNCIGMPISGLFLIAFVYVKSTMVAVILMVCTLGLHSGVHTGFHINHIDLAPNFAGPMMAFSNMIANLTNLLVPVMVSNVIKDDMTNQHRWQTAFLIIVVYQIITNGIFVIFVKGTVQPWNSYGYRKDIENGEKIYNLKEVHKTVENGDQNNKLKELVSQKEEPKEELVPETLLKS